MDFLGLDLYVIYSVAKGPDGKADGPVPAEFQDDQVTMPYSEFAKSVKSWCPADSKDENVVSMPYGTKKELMDMASKIPAGKANTIIVIDHGGDDADGFAVKVPTISGQFAGRKPNPRLFEYLTDKDYEDIASKAVKKLILTGCKCVSTEAKQALLDKIATNLKISILANKLETHYSYNRSENKTPTIDLAPFTEFPTKK